MTQDNSSIINKLMILLRKKYKAYLPDGTPDYVCYAVSDHLFLCLDDNKKLSKLLRRNNPATRRIFEEFTGLKIGRDITLREIAENEGSLLLDFTKYSLYK